MSARPLREILDRIEKYKAEFSEYDTEELEPAELTGMQYGDLTAKEEPAKYASGVMTDHGFIPIGLTPAERLEQKINALKTDPIFKRPSS